MFYQDLQSYLKHLEERDLLFRIGCEVDKEWELSCVARWVFQGLPEANRRGLLFEKVKGYDTPVAVGVLGASRRVYAAAVGADSPDDIRSVWLDALDHPILPTEVGASLASYIMQTQHGSQIV